MLSHCSLVKKFRRLFFSLEQIKFKEYRVVSSSGAVVRAEADKKSKRVGRVSCDDVVWVVDQQDERLKITRPLNGWISRINDKHYQLVEVNLFLKTF